MIYLFAVVCYWLISGLPIAGMEKLTGLRFTNTQYVAAFFLWWLYYPVLAVCVVALLPRWIIESIKKPR